MTRTALVTGSAGFIGYFTSKALLAQGWNVVGLDAMTDYYDVELKNRRHQMLMQSAGFSAVNARLETPNLLRDLFEKHQFDAVIHLAAQAGVRYSIEAPRSYVESNLVGTFELLEGARAYPPAHMLLASTSSVYGANTQMPYTENDKVDTQMSFYAATKKATEVMAHSYAHLYHLPITMFRFFTVYGPWGRPDMAHFKFTKAIIEGNPIEIYNHGKMKRDFTYIDDIVNVVAKIIEKNIDSREHYKIYNIGNNKTESLQDFITTIEQAIGKKAIKEMYPMQQGDVPRTFADVNDLIKDYKYSPNTDIKSGIENFMNWFLNYNKNN